MLLLHRYSVYLHVGVWGWRRIIFSRSQHTYSRAISWGDRGAKHNAWGREFRVKSPSGNACYWGPVSHKTASPLVHIHQCIFNTWLLYTSTVPGVIEEMSNGSFSPGVYSSLGWLSDVKHWILVFLKRILKCLKALWREVITWEKNKLLTLLHFLPDMSWLITI